MSDPAARFQAALGYSFDDEALLRRALTHRSYLAEHSFDHVMITHVVSVVSDPQKLMLWAQRMVKPGGRIVVLNGSRRPGHIYVEEVNVVHAELAQESGISAFNRMCFLNHGRFKFEPEFRAPQQTMAENGMAILLESARCRDESAREKFGTRVL